MTDYNSIWRTQDEIRTVVNAVLGECIWNFSYKKPVHPILGTATVKNGEALISTSIPSGDIAVVKVGGRSVKVIMR